MTSPLVREDRCEQPPPLGRWHQRTTPKSQAKIPAFPREPTGPLGAGAGLVGAGSLESVQPGRRVRSCISAERNGNVNGNRQPALGDRSRRAPACRQDLAQLLADAAVVVLLALL